MHSCWCRHTLFHIVFEDYIAKFNRHMLKQLLHYRCSQSAASAFQTDDTKPLPMTLPAYPASNPLHCIATPAADDSAANSTAVAMLNHGQQRYAPAIHT
jgi:hypothetical protein